MKKEEVIKEMLCFLIKHPFTQENEIKLHFEHLLKERGKIGEITKGNQYFRTTSFVEMSDKDDMLVNEVMWDLIIERILTPGINKLNDKLPFLRVTNMKKLEKKLKGL